MIKKTAMVASVMACLMSGQVQAGFWSFLGINKSTQTKKAYHNEEHIHVHDTSVMAYQVGTKQDFENWLFQDSERIAQVKDYKDYLSRHLGTEIPPMYELLTTARSWQQCGHEPYEVPPISLWENILPTLQLYAFLKWQGILPSDTHIRSVYRNPNLNHCAGGAISSKHLVNAAIDVWVPRYGDSDQVLDKMKDELCQFWNAKGEQYNLGLGLYATGAIHLDTQGYRKWGVEFTNQNSPCRETKTGI